MATLMEYKVFNDPIHGTVSLHPLLVNIIDTPQFQRLRYLKQLGAGYFVYPGASHNRFEHSIGVAHLAGELVKALKTKQTELETNDKELNITEEDILCVQIAGLCHDLGHGPFSHQFETFINRTRPDRKWEHEEASLKMFDHMVERNHLKEKMKEHGLDPSSDVDFIKGMIKGRPTEDPKPEGSPQPTEDPKPEGSPQPTEDPKPEGSPQPTEDPKPEGSPQPTEDPKPEGSPQPTEDPKPEGSPPPTEDPKPEGSPQPTEDPKPEGSPQPTEDPKPGDSPPSFKDRSKKLFLYEIVANKKNGIDVDKFDYLARDAHHLGIKENFDHLRFIQFARVCDVDGVQQICTRDKEVNNLYDLFHLRYCLHRRAYQHKVKNSIESMIIEAFVKADKHIQIKGSDGKKHTLSTAIDDMEAYTKLTDDVFGQILHSSTKGLKAARDILSRIVSRQHYRFLGETKPTKDMITKGMTPRDVEAMKRRWKKELAKACDDDTLTADDFEVHIVKMDYGKKDKDPIKEMWFYSKRDPTKGVPLTGDQESMFQPTCFSEQLIRVYCKKIDETSLTDARDHMIKWCKNNGWPTPEAVEDPVEDPVDDPVERPSRKPSRRPSKTGAHPCGKTSKTMTEAVLENED